MLNIIQKLIYKYIYFNEFFNQGTIFYNYDPNPIVILISNVSLSVNNSLTTEKLS